MAAVQAAVGRPEPEPRAARLPAAQPAAVLRVVLRQQTPWQETAPQRTALQTPELLQKPAPRAAASQRQEKGGPGGGVRATSRQQTAPAV